MRADPDMVVCRCCRQAYPPESFRLMGGGARRRKCRACEVGCAPGGSAHKAKVRRANRRRAGRPQWSPRGAQFIPVAISERGKARVGTKSTLIACGVPVRSVFPFDTGEGLWR